ncbi:MAG: PqqD family protein [Roseovarius sp.]
MTSASEIAMAKPRHRTPAAGAHHQCAPAAILSSVQSAKVAHTVDVAGCDVLGEALATVMPAWGITVAKARASEAPGGADRSAICQEGDGTYCFQSCWGESPLTGLGIAGATCGAVADLIQAYVDARPDVLGLHCGAIRIGGHLVAFTGSYRAGKSTLVTRLASETGCALFCDDILPVDAAGTAMALGVQPRLRLPLPDGVTPAFREEVAGRLTVKDHRYGYVRNPGQAPFGTRAPLAAMVVLRRQDGARARLHRLPTSQAAAFLIRQNIADPGDPEAHYDRISSLAEGLVCLTLVYCDLEEAVALVRSTFWATEIPRHETPLGPALPVEEPDERAQPADLSAHYARAGDVITRRIGDDTFLWQMKGRNFFSLNPIGGAIWTLLELPQSGTDIATTLHEVFPETPAPSINHDVAKLLGQLQDRGLVVH